MKIIHFDSYTPDVFGYTDDQWVGYRAGFGPNRALSLLTRMFGWDCSTHCFTRERRTKTIVRDDLNYLFHPVNFPYLPRYAQLTSVIRLPIYRHQLQYSSIFTEYLQKSPPNIFVFNITTGMSCYVISRFLQRRAIPYVAHIHGGTYRRSILRGRFLRSATAVIVTSQHERNQIVNSYDVSSEKISIIAVGADTDQYKPRQRDRNDRPYPALLFVGRIVRTKGVLEAIQCLPPLISEFPEAHITVVGPIGDAEYYEEIQTFVKDNGLHQHVQFLGTIPNAALPEIYDNADLFVFPSRFTEGNPAVVMESMASGTPAIALETTPGANEVILHGQNGLLSRPADLAQDVRDLLRDRSRLDQMAKQCRQRIIQDYSLVRAFEAHRNLYTTAAADELRS